LGPREREKENLMLMGKIRASARKEEVESAKVGTDRDFS